MSYVQALKRLLPRMFWPYLGVVHRRVRSIPVRTGRQKRRVVYDLSLSESDRELLGKASSRIYFNDGMYVGDGDHYFRVGLSAIRCIDEAMRHARLNQVQSILDLPCGGGRVLRLLACRFPTAKITACDLQRDMVDFCAEEFGASPIYSSPDFDQLSIGALFDLIWCGSLVTHLNAPGINSLLEFFARQLTPGGLVVFTTHGARARERMLDPSFDYGVSRESIAELTAAFQKKGFSFASYPNEDDYGVPANEGLYGISLTSRAWVGALAERLGLTEIYFSAQGWDNHHDVYGFLKR